MKYLKKFNENLEDSYFPNPDKAIDTIDFYISQYSDDGFNIEKIPGWGAGTRTPRTNRPEWSTSMRDTENKIKYYFRVFPNDVERQIQRKSAIDPRIDCHLTSKDKNSMKKLYKEMENLPKALLQDDLYSYLTINDEDDDFFINLTVFTNQEDLDKHWIKKWRIFHPR
jgi:hypothetical protein